MKDDDLPFLFVTNDEKDDWYEYGDSRPVGPRSELVREFRARNPNGYHQVNLSRFLRMAKDHLAAKVQQDTIDSAARLPGRPEVEALLTEVWTRDQDAWIDHLIEAIVDEETLKDLVDLVIEGPDLQDGPATGAVLDALVDSPEGMRAVDRLATLYADNADEDSRPGRRILIAKEIIRRALEARIRYAQEQAMRERIREELSRPLDLDDSQ